MANLEVFKSVFFQREVREFLFWFGFKLHLKACKFPQISFNFIFPTCHTNSKICYKMHDQAKSINSKCTLNYFLCALHIFMRLLKGSLDVRSDEQGKLNCFPLSFLFLLYDRLICFGLKLQSVL